ncbi:rhodanese-like domain-containing protein [Streptomyces sp. NPDC021608]|uniref:rhodanese-like domain-containing protein n=1 Tax=Streptomyces sp. NPDC021608 TaxID=3154903 RepID=UPI0033D6A6C2
MLFSRRGPGRVTLPRLGAWRIPLSRLGRRRATPSRPRPGRVTAAEARRALQDGTVLLLDVREATEWQAGHVPGAHHLPLSRLAAGADVPGARPGMRLVTICRSGRRSQEAARLLSKLGFEAADVIGGMERWARRGLPVEDDRGRPGTVV